MKKIIFGIVLSLCSLAAFAQGSTGENKISPVQKLNDEYCTGLFKSYDGIIFDMQNENESAISYKNVLNWLNGRVSGLQLYYTRDRVPVPFITNTKASIFVDESPVDPGVLNNISVADIAMIKIIKGPFAGAVGNGGGGTIAIYTLKCDDDGDDDDD